MATNITISTGGTTTVVTVPETQNNVTVSRNQITTDERTKLAGIEAGATGDLTASEVKTLYESNSDTNALTDANNTKLGYISIGNNRDIDVMNADIQTNNAKPFRVRGRAIGDQVFLDHEDPSNNLLQNPQRRVVFPTASETSPGIVNKSAQTFVGVKTFSNGLSGNLSGNVTGNVTGDLTGDVTGNVTGNVTGDLTGNADTVTNGVYTTGNQTIGGNKTFTGTTTLGATILGPFSSTGAIISGSVSATGLTVNGPANVSSLSVSTSLQAQSINLIDSNNGEAEIVTLQEGLSPSDLLLKSNGNVTIYLDQDNNESGQKFIVANNAGTEKFSAQEDGTVTVYGKIVSTSNGDIDIEPNGTGNVLLGNFKFDADQAVGQGQNDYVLTYNASNGLISLEEATGGGAVDSVNGQTGVVSLTFDDLSDVNSITTNDHVVSYDSATSKFVGDGRLTTLYNNLKAGSSTSITNGAGSTTSLDLSATTANLKTGVTGVDFTETSPGEIDFTVASGAEGAETEFVAMEINGTTTADTANILVKNGSNFKIESSTASANLRFTGGTNINVSLPSSSGTLALTSELYADSDADARIAAASIDDLSDVDTSTVAPTDGQALVWDNTASKWEPGTVSGGSSVWTTSGNNIYYNTGNVGIGTASPSQALHVSGTDKHIYIEDGNLKLDRNNEGRIEFGISGQMYGTSNGNNVYLQKSGNNHRIDFGTNGGTIKVSDTSVNNDFFTITTEGFESYSGSYFRYIQHNAANNNSGKVLEYSNGSASVNRGIVKVNGDLKVNDYTTGSAVQRIKLGNDGLVDINDGINNVLISTGNSTITASSTVAVGYQALKSLTSGANNTALGYQASYSNTTGTRNLAFGYQTNYAVTTGSNNTGVGWQSNRFAVTTSNNTGVGYLANSRSTGSNNTAIGAEAAEGVIGSSTFSNTTAVGYNALNALTTGSSNTAIGYNSARLSATSNNLTAVGFATLQGNTTGTNSTIVGASAATVGSFSNVTAIGYGSAQYGGGGQHNAYLGSFTGRYNSGSGNVLVGQDAGQGSSGSDFAQCVGIGYRAMSTLTTGDNNVAIGYHSGQYITTGDRNTLLGTYAGKGVSGTSTFTNTVGVGYQALTALTSGAGNTAVGYQAGAALTANSSVTAVWYQAAYQLATGNNAVAIGYHALENLTTVSGDYGALAIGVRANEDKTSITNSTSIGNRSNAGSEAVAVGGASNANGSRATAVGQFARAGAYSTVIGAGAGDHFANVQRSVLIGRDAGGTNVNSDSVMIGHQAGSQETGTHKLYIENSNSTTPRIYGEIDNDILRVNGTLQVNDPSSTGYSFPTATGTTGQVLEVNASGDLVFATPSGSGGGLGGADQTLTADRTIDTNGYNLDIELDPTGTPDTFTIHDGTHDLFQVDTSTSGDIFSVNDVSGLPEITVNTTNGVDIPNLNFYKGCISGKGGQTSNASFGTKWRSSMSGQSLGRYQTSANISILTVSSGTPSVGDTVSANNYAIATAYLLPGINFSKINLRGNIRAYNANAEGETQHMEVWTFDQTDISGFGTTTCTFRGKVSYTFDSTSATIKPILINSDISYSGDKDTGILIVSHAPTNPSATYETAFMVEVTVT